jgi:hypothetical protein
MGQALLSTILAVLLTIGAGPLEARRTAWPDWRLPAPLPRPGRGDLIYPAWFAGDWQVTSREVGEPAEKSLRWQVRFQRGPDGAVVGARAANAAAVGRALLGEELEEVRDDPANPNRQLARLSGQRSLESTVIGRRSEGDDDGSVFLADELVLQVLHRPNGDPRVSRIETLSRYERRGTPSDGEGGGRGEGDGWIEAEQWQARYASPAEGLTAAAVGSGHWHLRLDRLPPGFDPAT